MLQVPETSAGEAAEESAKVYGERPREPLRGADRRAGRVRRPSGVPPVCRQAWELCS